VKLENLFRGEISSGEEGALQALMRAILVRSQFVPGVRYSLGWRGLKQSVVGDLEGWTARINGHPGVYGLSFAGLEDNPKWLSATFNLCYFPDAAEELVERCSLRAAALTQQPDYISLIREFIQHKDMFSLFSVGGILLCVDDEKQALCLGMESLTAQRSIAKDGVELLRDGKNVQVIAAGEYDQDFPALSMTQDFFEVLAASVSFHLEEPPSWLLERRFPGMEIVYSREGIIQEKSAADIDKVFIGLGYGHDRFDNLFDKITGTSGQTKTETHWKKGDKFPHDYEKKRWWSAHHARDYKTLDKKILGIDERPPLVILSGFLGAGKTSFLQHFIEYQTQRSRFVAVIQNEIGEVGLDGKLLDYTVTEIDEGCVCCSLVGNLKRAVQGILSEFQPDFIILETTGAANPLNLIDEISEIAPLVRYDSAVTVVDALNFEYALKNFSIAADQIRAANVLLLNKCDLVGDEKIEKIREELKKINPRAIIFTTIRGDLNPSLIFDTGSPLDEKEKSRATLGAELPVFNVHARDGLWCKTLAVPRPLDREQFLSAIESMPLTVFRVKGIVEFSDDPTPMVFQYVAGRFELSKLSSAETKERFLTIIAQGKESDLADDFWKTGVNPI